METGRGVNWKRWITGSIAGLAILAIFAFLAIAVLPFSLFKDSIAKRIGQHLGTSVSIGSIERREIFSFSPTILIRDIAIRQPLWAGRGDMVRAHTLEARVPILPLLRGGRLFPRNIVAHGLEVALVRDRNGRANWKRQQSSPDRSGEGNGLSGLTIPNGRISLRDEKRFLTIGGTFQSDARGLRIAAAGRFHDAPIRLSLNGLAGDAPYPLRLDIQSPLLALQAQGRANGALNLRSIALDIHAVAPNLKYLDDIIEAGLFGTQPIDLRARVRHEGKDWFVDRMTGNIGRSTLIGKADVRKQGGRTKIDADMHFLAFDFDDLSDARGKAKAEAIEARIGERVLPGTRINLAKVGPTDGVIRFRADRLLLADSVFRSLVGVIRLDGKLLTIDDVVAGMSSGRMTGKLRIDQRGGAVHPRLSIDLAFVDGRLEYLLGTNDAAGPLRGRVILAGAGDTIRDALAHADGRAGIIVRDGTVKRTVAAVLGQDLGKAIGAALHDGQTTVPLRCLAIGFAARGGTLSPSPFIVDTGISVGQGQGHLSLATETIALTLKGRARHASALPLVNPLTIGGTFSAPTLSAAGTPPGHEMKTGSILRIIGKSIGSALGIGEDEYAGKNAVPMAVDCDAVARRIL